VGMMLRRSARIMERLTRHGAQSVPRKVQRVAASLDAAVARLLGG
jgi:hypothetical protein